MPNPNTGFVCHPGIEGVWALEQIGTEGALNTAAENRIRQAIQFNNMRGFCLRTQWNTLEPTRGNYDFDILDHALAVVNSVPNRKLAVRIIMGQYTPAYVFAAPDAGRWFFTGYQANGSDLPKFSCDTTANTFLRTSHGLTNGTQVRVDADTYPGGVNGQTAYFVRQATANTIQLATTNSDTTIIDLTGPNLGTIIRIASATRTRAPDACLSNGTPNTGFINRWYAIDDELSAWARANGVPLFHRSWTSRDYSEIAHGGEVRSTSGASGGGQGRAGYDSNAQNFVDAYKLLIDHAISNSDANLAAGFGMSGAHVEDVQLRLVNYINTQIGDWNGRVYINANGLSQTGDWGASTTESTQDSNCGFYPNVNQSGKRVARGEQMIQPGNYSATYWAGVFQNLRNNVADFVEIYTNDGSGVGAPGTSFTGSGASALQAEINSWVPTLITPGGPVNQAIVSSDTGLAVETQAFTELSKVSSDTAVSTEQQIASNEPELSAADVAVASESAVLTAAALVDSDTALSTEQIAISKKGEVGTLFPIDLAVASPGPLAVGFDGLVYYITRPSASDRAHVYRGTAGHFEQIADEIIEDNLVIPLAIAVDEDGVVLFGTQGTGVYVGEPAPPSPPPGPGGGGGIIEADLIVEGIHWSLQPPSTWGLELQTASASVFAGFWALGDPVSGVLDQTAIVAI